MKRKQPSTNSHRYYALKKSEPILQQIQTHLWQDLLANVDVFDLTLKHPGNIFLPTRQVKQNKTRP